ncbi:MAG: hypothetical protein ACI8PT_002093 [Gammaproteobacteria bacterium]|jgi:hypothetical protein
MGKPESLTETQNEVAGCVEWARRANRLGHTLSLFVMQCLTNKAKFGERSPWVHTAENERN